jgi:tetratricopeptide (TPR) repeat protein
MDTINQPNQSSVDTVQVPTESKGRLERISFIVLLTTIILGSLAFIPSLYVPIEMVKNTVITFGILISSLLYFLSAFKNKSLYIPKHPIFLASCGIVLSLIVSTMFSTNIWKSVFGQGFELGTVSMILVLFLGAFLTLNLTRNEKDRILYVYGSILFSFAIIFVFHVIRIFGGADLLGFSIFKTTTSTIFGKWNDLSILSGIVFILSYLGLRMISLKGSFKILLTVVSILSFVFAVLVNSSIVWSMFLLTMILLAIYEYRNNTSNVAGISGMIKRIPVLTSIIVIVVILGLWKGDAIVNPIISKLNISQTEVNLPWQLSLDVATDTIKESPFFGAGPNRFGNQYLKFKPPVVNPTIFWNTEFGSGFGTIPTFVVTQGLVGIALWLAFIVIFIYSGFKALKKKSDNLSIFFTTSTFFTALFLWLVNIVYLPSHAVLLLTFIMTGLFLACLVNEGEVVLVDVSKDEGIVKKLTPLVLIVIFAICVIWTAVYTKKVLAIGYFQGGISALNLPNGQGMAKAQDNFKKALALDKNDTYYQALSEINILKISNLVQQIQSKQNTSQEILKEVATLTEEALKYTREAINTDPTNYYNYISEARISEVALTLQAPNAYENIKNSYANALKYNPYSPLIYPTRRAVSKPITQLSGVEKGTFAGVRARLECPLQEDREEDLRTRFSNFADEVQAMKALGASVAGSYCEICPYVGLSEKEAAEVRIRSARQETELMRARAARLLAEKELNDALKEAGLPIE